MIRSLRVRFFLLVWPLVVLALVILGSLLGRWTVVELSRVSAEIEHDRAVSDVTAELADSLAVVDADDTEAMQALLTRMSARDSLARGAVVLSAGRGLIATALSGLGSGDVSVGPGREVNIGYSRRAGNTRSLLRFIGGGRSLDPTDASDPRLLVVLPALATRVTAPTHELPIDNAGALKRRIAIALVIGSVIAALVTLVLSGQLTGRVEKLAEGVRSLGRGNLAARVPVRGGDEIAALAASFNAMAAGLEASEAQRRQMVSDVAHELRTPLTNLIALLAAARDGLRPANDELLATLADEADLLNRLVDDLRDLALADAGDLTLQLERLDVVLEARRAVASFAGDARGVTVRLDGAPSATAMADARRLAQVLRNLVQNAVTHSPKGGTVEVAVATGDGQQVTLSVSDHGPGIAPEHLPHIWERFYRIDPSRSRATGGMGLGLSVARRLVEAMAGTIEVESEVGVGSRFTVRLGGVVKHTAA
jgi:signal transduction histidine kinase